MTFDLRASGFDEFSVVDAGRAGGHAGHAAEAGIEMADPLRVHGRVALAGEFHQVDAAARRIHFFVPEDVRGTDRQAEAAMDTVFDDLLGRWMVGVEGTW